jgi:mannose-6-phosphate isomerase
VAGLTRELHTDFALDAIDFSTSGAIKSQAVGIKNRPVMIQQSEYFTVNLIDANQNLQRDCSETESFIVHLCIEGAYDLRYADGSVKISLGEAVLIPAIIEEVQIIPAAGCKILETYINQSV